MKTKTLCIFLLAIFAGFQAATAKEREDKPFKTVIQYFIDSHINSDAKKLNEVLSEEAVYRIPRRGKIMQQSRSELLSALRKDNGVVQNCSSQFEILGATDALVLARVDFKYPEFTQQNYLTLEKEDNKEWKITVVYKIFNDNAPSGSPAPVSTAN